MFSSIVVGTDGSATATAAVRQAVDMAKAVGAKVELVSAFTPVPKQRLREERRDAPEDIRWAIDPRREAEASLDDAADVAREAGVEQVMRCLLAEFDLTLSLSGCTSVGELTPEALAAAGR